MERKIEIGDFVEYQGGWYVVEDIITLENIAGSLPFAKLSDYDNPVPLTEIKLIPQELG